MKSGVFMSARFVAHEDRKVVLLVGFIIYDGPRLPLKRRIVFHWGSMNTILIRQAVLSDIEELAPLLDQYRQFYGRESDLQAAREFLLARFNHGESVLFIAYEAGIPAGFVQLYPSFSSASLARTFILNDLFVIENCRRKKVGALLLEAAADFAKSLGAGRLTLSTALTNKPAQALYESAGWKRDEQFIVYHYAI